MDAVIRYNSHLALLERLHAAGVPILDEIREHRERRDLLASALGVV